MLATFYYLNRPDFQIILTLKHHARRPVKAQDPKLELTRQKSILTHNRQTSYKMPKGIIETPGVYVGEIWLCGQTPQCRDKLMVVNSTLACIKCGQKQGSKFTLNALSNMQSPTHWTTEILPPTKILLPSVSGDKKVHSGPPDVLVATKANSIDEDNPALRFLSDILYINESDNEPVYTMTTLRYAGSVSELIVNEQGEEIDKEYRIYDAETYKFSTQLKLLSEARIWWSKVTGKLGL